MLCLLFFWLLLFVMYSKMCHNDRLTSLEAEKERMDTFCDYQLNINDLTIEKLVEIEEELQISNEDTGEALWEEKTNPMRAPHVTRELDAFEDEWQ